MDNDSVWELGKVQVGCVLTEGMIDGVLVGILVSLMMLLIGTQRGECRGCEVLLVSRQEIGSGADKGVVDVGSCDRGNMPVRVDDEGRPINEC